jgi:gluconolactonase
MTDWTWEQINHHSYLTEGPVWDGTVLLYNECAGNTTWRYHPAGGVASLWRSHTEGANGQNYSPTGRLFNCEGTGKRITEVSLDAAPTVVADNFEGVPFNAPNDLAIDTTGRIWFSDPNYGERPTEMTHESVYRLDESADGWAVTRVSFDTSRPNGVLLSKDEKTLFVAESPHVPERARQLRAYPITEDGGLGEHVVLHDFDGARGIDGMCLNSDGNIVATAGNNAAGPGPMIYIFSPDGEVLSTYETPVDGPTNCAFAEDDLSVLYVTFATGYLYRVPNTGMSGHILFPQPACEQR